MTAAKENIQSLPDYCFGVLLTDKSLIRINTGESGYYRQRDFESILEKGETTDDLANRLNADMGVNIQQRKAIEFGSMFGWSSPMADPCSYDETGKPYCAKNPRK